MKPEKLLEKLESYEQAAYDGGMGSDWLERIGEGFKFYVERCANESKTATVPGFVKYIDQLAHKLELVKVEVSR